MSWRSDLTAVHRFLDGAADGQCGKSGNSVMDNAELSVARGLPMEFRHFREKPRGAKQIVAREAGMPGEGATVDPL
ncbi:MAG: hypothetical protein WED09_03490 [Homoserinimonas sp.]